MPLHPPACRPTAEASRPTACSARIRKPTSTSTVKAGRFGPYIQLGEQKDYAEGEKPRRAGIPKNMVTRRHGIGTGSASLLSLPREIGTGIRKTGEPITAGIGRFGPFVQSSKRPTPASKPAMRCSTSVSTARSTLIAEKIAKGPSEAAASVPIPASRLASTRALGGGRRQERPLWRLRDGRRRQRHDSRATRPPTTITLAEAIAADRRARCQGRRQAETRRQEGCSRRRLRPN